MAAKKAQAPAKVKAKPKLDTMNTELAKAGAYNQNDQKQVTKSARRTGSPRPRLTVKKRRAVKFCP